MYHWVREFLSEWSVQVRVGAELSSVQTIESGARNGSPQGATISPILFICMVNDFPDSLQGVETSLLPTTVPYISLAEIWLTYKKSCREA